MISKEIQIAILKRNFDKIENKKQEYRGKIAELELIENFLKDKKERNLEDINDSVVLQQLLSLEIQRDLIESQKNNQSKKKFIMKWIKKAIF